MSFFPGVGFVFLLVLLILASTAVWTLVRLWRSVVIAFDGRGRRAAIEAATVLIGASMAWMALHVGDYTHLALACPRYLAVIYRAGAERTVPIAFDWGRPMLWVTDPYEQRTLIYDSRPHAPASVGNRFEKRNDVAFAIDRRHLFGDFYIDYERIR